MVVNNEENISDLDFPEYFLCDQMTTAVEIIEYYLIHRSMKEIDSFYIVVVLAQ